MRLAITRNREELATLIEQAARHDVELVPLPLSRIVPIPFDWPDALALDRIDWLVFSSGNGVRSFFERLDQLSLTISNQTKIACVGERTAAAFTDLAGRQVDFVPHDAYGEIMFGELLQNHDLSGKNLLYARAEKINFDPGQLLIEAGVVYFPLVTYRSDLCVIDPTTVKQLTRDDYILFTSPSNVRSYQSQFGRPITKLIAMGHTTARSMNQAGWSGFAIMNKKNIETVLELI